MDNEDRRERGGIQRSDQQLVLIGIRFAVVRQYLPCRILAHVGEKNAEEHPSQQSLGWGACPQRRGKDKKTECNDQSLLSGGLERYEKGGIRRARYCLRISSHERAQRIELWQ